MNTLPPSLKSVSDFFERLPGIGNKTAYRLAFYLLRLPENDLKQIGKTFETLKLRTKRCSLCMNLTEDEECEVCKDEKRDKTIITVVEDVMDLISLETGNIYNGQYHVLHGKLDPLNHVGPQDLYMDSLFKRITMPQGSQIKEIILATGADMEGEATSMYIRNKLVELKKSRGLSFTVTRLGYGLPIGANLEYADYLTLRKSLENRNKYE